MFILKKLFSQYKIYINEAKIGLIGIGILAPILGIFYKNNSLMNGRRDELFQKIIFICNQNKINDFFDINNVKKKDLLSFFNFNRFKYSNLDNISNILDKDIINKKKHFFDRTSIIKLFNKNKMFFLREHFYDYINDCYFDNILIPALPIFNKILINQDNKLCYLIEKQLFLQFYYSLCSYLDLFLNKNFKKILSLFLNSINKDKIKQFILNPDNEINLNDIFNKDIFNKISFDYSNTIFVIPLIKDVIEYSKIDDFFNVNLIQELINNFLSNYKSLKQIKVFFEEKIDFIFSNKENILKNITNFFKDISNMLNDWFDIPDINLSNIFNKDIDFFNILIKYSNILLYYYFNLNSILRNHLKHLMYKFCYFTETWVDNYKDLKNNDNYKINIKKIIDINKQSNCLSIFFDHTSFLNYFILSFFINVEFFLDLFNTFLSDSFLINDYFLNNINNFLYKLFFNIKFKFPNELMNYLDFIYCKSSNFSNVNEIQLNKITFFILSVVLEMYYENINLDFFKINLGEKHNKKKIDLKCIKEYLTSILPINDYDNKQINIKKDLINYDKNIFIELLFFNKSLILFSSKLFYQFHNYKINNGFYKNLNNKNKNNKNIQHIFLYRDQDIRIDNIIEHNNIKYNFFDIFNNNDFSKFMKNIVIVIIIFFLFFLCMYPTYISFTVFPPIFQYIATYFFTSIISLLLDILNNFIYKKNNFKLNYNFAYIIDYFITDIAIKKSFLRTYNLLLKDKFNIIEYILNLIKNIFILFFSSNEVNNILFILMNKRHKFYMNKLFPLEWSFLKDNCFYFLSFLNYYYIYILLIYPLINCDNYKFKFFKLLFYLLIHFFFLLFSSFFIAKDLDVIHKEFFLFKKYNITNFYFSILFLPCLFLIFLIINILSLNNYKKNNNIYNNKEYSEEQKNECFYIYPYIYEIPKYLDIKIYIKKNIKESRENINLYFILKILLLVIISINFFFNKRYILYWILDWAYSSIFNKINIINK